MKTRGEPAAAAVAETPATRSSLTRGAGRRIVCLDAHSPLPAHVTASSREVFLVSEFGLGERLIENGADSRRVLCTKDGWSVERAAVMVADHGGPDGLTPPTPFDLGRRCLVIIPTYNEADNLERMTRAISAHLECDILVVDDNSPDGTGRIAHELAAELAHVHVLARPGRMGLGSAYLAGFRWGLARGHERLFEMDCDFSHSPGDLARLARASLHADLVIGSRYIKGGATVGWKASRRLLSRSANIYTRALLGSSVRDWTAGFRCYARDLLLRIPLDRVRSSGYSFQIEMTWHASRAGAAIREIPIRFTDRLEGKSKMNKAIALEAVRRTLALRMSHSRSIEAE